MILPRNLIPLCSSGVLIVSATLVVLIGARFVGPSATLSQEPLPELPLPVPIAPPSANGAVSTEADPSLFPAAVPVSAPEGLDPGATPAVPVFGPHAGALGPGAETEAPTAEGTPLDPAGRPLLPPQTSDSGGISESDIRAYLVPEMDLTPVQTEPGGAIWERNASLAFHKAKTLQRPLLLLFTAQWNPLCQKLSEEVFTSNSFNEFAREKCIICYVDYPQNKGHATESMLRVKEKYQIRGYPTLMVFDPDGNVVRQMTGYRAGRAVTYYNELHEAVEPLCIYLDARKEKLISQGYRDWTSSVGTTVFAGFDSHNDEKVLIRGPAGDRWILPISTLTPNDQALVRSFPTWAEMHPESATPEP